MSLRTYWMTRSTIDGVGAMHDPMWKRRLIASVMLYALSVLLLLAVLIDPYVDIQLVLR